MQPAGMQLSLVGPAALALALALASFGVAADDPLAAPPKPGTLIILGRATADGPQAQSLVYAWDRKAAEPDLLSRQRSAMVGNLA